MFVVHAGKPMSLKGLQLKPAEVEDGHKLLKFTVNMGRGILL